MIPYASRTDLGEALCNAAAAGSFNLVSTLLSISDPEKQLSANTIAKLQRKSVSVEIGMEPVLNLATRSLDVQCVKILLEKGADVSLRGRKPEADKNNQNKSNVRMYWHAWRPESSYSALHVLAKAITDSAQEPAAREILNLLLAAGADLEARDDEGDTPLLTGIGNKRHSHHAPLAPLRMKILLDAGADPNAENTKTGETILFYACRSISTTELAEQILQLGGDVSKRAFNGETVLHRYVVISIFDFPLQLSSTDTLFSTRMVYTSNDLIDLTLSDN